MIARVAEYAHFVFDLHHQHGVVAAVDFFDVLHEGGEGAGVGLLGGGAEGAEDFDFAAVLDDAGKAAGILFDPDGRVAGHAVLPRGEPEEDDALVLVRAPGREGRRRGRSRIAFAGLNQFPAQRRDHGVEAHAGQLGPDGLHVVEAGRGGVVQLAAENQEWLAIDDELRGGAALFKMRCGVLLRGSEGRLGAEEEQKNWQRAERGFA